jgi:hypothetical protein
MDKDIKKLKDLTNEERNRLASELEESTGKLRKSMGGLTGSMSTGIPKGILEIFENQRKLEQLKEDALALKISKHMKKDLSNGLGSSTENSVPTSKIITDKLDKILEMKQEQVQVINKTENNFNGINNGNFIQGDVNQSFLETNAKPIKDESMTAIIIETIKKYWWTLVVPLVVGLILLRIERPDLFP